MLPLAALSALQTALPPAARLPFTAVNPVAEPTLASHVSAPPTIPHLPFELVNVNPSPASVAEKVAQVPVVYHVPLLMIHPFLLPSTSTLIYPFPLNGVPGADVLVGAGPPTVVLVALGWLADLGRYLMPVCGHVDFVPSGFAGTKSPVCKLPRTS